MRFLFLITHYEPVVYGAEMFAKKLAEFLAASGHHVDLVTGKWEPEWLDYEKIHGVHVHRVSVIKIRFIQTLAFVWPQFKKAQELIGSGDYDFIHAHIFPSLITGAFLKSKAKKVVTIQGGDLADYPEIYGPLAPVLKPVIGYSLKHYNKVHAVSTDLKRQIGKISGKTAIVIPNGVDQNLLETDQYRLTMKTVNKIPEAKFLIFSSSRLTPKNNLTATIHAIKHLRDQDLDVALIIAGEGHLKPQLKQLIAELKLQKKVVLLGHCDHEQVMALVKHCHLFVRVSLQEGFGISVIEAMAAGIPVVASQVGGLADFVNSEWSYVPQSAKSTAIAKAIQTALVDTLVYQKTNKAKEMVKAKFTWQKILPLFLSKVYSVK